MYEGVIAPVVSPLTDDDEICQRSVAALVEFVRPHVGALMPCLTSGEGWKLSSRQWCDMVKFSKRYARDLPVFAGIELPTTSEVLKRVRTAEELAVEGVVLTTPFGTTVSQEAMYEHYRVIAENTKTAIFVYNESNLSRNVTTPETLLRICQLRQIVGIKESSGNIETSQRLKALGLADRDVPIYQGWENLLLQSGNLDGYVVSLANIEPAICARMFDYGTSDIQNEIDALCQRHEIFADDWYRAIKAELKIRGVLETARVIGRISLG